jgi:hypothetical protein
MGLKDEKEVICGERRGGMGSPRIIDLSRREIAQRLDLRDLSLQALEHEEAEAASRGKGEKGTVLCYASREDYPRR